MLVLSRKYDEAIVIGEPGPNQVRVVVVEIRGDKVRLGVHAETGVPVDREEVYDAKQRQRLAASGPKNCMPDVSTKEDAA